MKKMWQAFPCNFVPKNSFRALRNELSSRGAYSPRQAIEFKIRCQYGTQDLTGIDQVKTVYIRTLPLRESMSVYEIERSSDEYI